MSSPSSTGESRRRQGYDAADPNVTAAEFNSLFDELSNWDRWGADDERGALHFLTPARVTAGARLVSDGVSVSLSLPLNTHAASDNPVPANHHMTLLGRSAASGEPVHFIKDYVGLDYHNDGHTHLDALCHVGYEGSLYNGRPEDVVTPHGAQKNTVEVLNNGLIGRGVLLDVPRARAFIGSSPVNTFFGKTSRPRSADSAP